MKKHVLNLLLIICFYGCHTFLIDKEFAAKQMTNLKISKDNGIGLGVDLGNGLVTGNSSYSNDLNYLVIKNKLLEYDTISPFGMKFFLTNGNKSGYISTSKLIFKDGYFISFKDTSLKTNPNCKTCKIKIDSIEKILIRGSRINKVKR